MQFRFARDQPIPKEPPLLPWLDELKATLIAKNRQFQDNNSRSHHQPKYQSIWKPFASSSAVEEKHSYKLGEDVHGSYCQYIPVSQNLSNGCEVSDYFPYIQYLKESSNVLYELEMFRISTTMKNSRCIEEWRELSRAYAPAMSVEEVFNYYNLLMAKGTQVLSLLKAKNKRLGKCRLPALLYKVLEVKKFMESYERMNVHLTVSIERGEEINLQNLSKTMKHLFCAICLVYDCSKHMIPQNVVENRYQYINAYNVREKCELRKATALELFQNLAVIVKRSETGCFKACSMGCYLNLMEESWQNLCKKREKKIFSLIFISMVRMGMEMFGYAPCCIRNLFESSPLVRSSIHSVTMPVQCEDIFYYIMKDYSLFDKLEYKFYDSEKMHLENEVQKFVVETAECDKKTRKKAPKKGAQKARNCKQEDEDSYNSICYHYFLDKQPLDVECLSCDCQKRGYCLPECLCSEECQIPLKGCRCRGEASCMDNRCVCFKQHRACSPDSCDGCCRVDDQNCKLNWCQNNEMAYSQRKLTRVGRSRIPNAGLGLFAGEFIGKSSFILKYLGELIESDSLEKLRENLVENNLFYNFRLTKYKSIDSRMFGNKARFVNHSKQNQNVYAAMIKINEEEHMLFFALKDIATDEELLLNYNGTGELSEFKDKYPFID